MHLQNLLNFLPSSLWAIPLTLVVYLVQKFFIPQILEFRKIIRRARYDVVYYANIHPNGKVDLAVNQKKYESVSKELRVISARLMSTRDDIPCYFFVEKTGLVPKYENTQQASLGFIAWSNMVLSLKETTRTRRNCIKEIGVNLNMPF